MKPARSGDRGGDPFTTILDCIADGVFTVDLDGRVTFMNRAAEEITGFRADEAMGRPCSEVFQAGICATDCTIRRAREEDRPVARRVRILDRQGRPVTVSVRATALRDVEGAVIGGVETFRDLTEEEELRKAVLGRYTFHDLVSKSPGMHEIFAILADVAEADSTVLIEGESGTGKELVARAIHDLSSRREGPFVIVNCGALPDTLLESELFGHVRGAFTDARRDRPGRFQMAHGGTIFLDEIGNVSPALQVRLLRVLQDGVFEPLGATRSARSDARVVAATNARLTDRVEAGSFRMDLYYRLNVVRLQLPPLRERREDIPLLVDHFCRRFRARTGRAIEGVDDAVIETLMRHDFPGNVRELENIIERAFVLCRGPLILNAHLPPELLARLGDVSESEPRSLKEHEEQVIRATLRRRDGNRQATAGELGIDPSTLWRKMKRYGIREPF